MLISVVMTVFNGEEFLQEAIDSVLEQSYTNFEFIIVDDGSNKNTNEMLDQVLDPRVKVLHLNPNQGQANALNVGIDIAKGEWIIRQDADDISLPNRIMEQVGFVQRNPHLIALGTHIDCFTESQLVPKEFLSSVNNYHNNIQTEEDLLMEQFHSCPLSHGSMMFLKQAFLKAGRYNPKYKITQDYDLWMRMFETGPIGILPKVLYQYRILPTSLSQNDHTEFRREMREISVTYLLRMLATKFNKHHPKFIILGPEAVCSFIKKYTCPKTRMNVVEFLDAHDQKTLNWMFDKVSKAKVDGIIILDGNGANASIAYLKNKGLIFNQNLFNIA
jgi:GT2 family glycosyltransferase